MNRVIRREQGVVVEMHDRPCVTTDDYERVKQLLIEAGRGFNAEGYAILPCKVAQSSQTALPGGGKTNHGTRQRTGAFRGCVQKERAVQEK